jgi:FKBP-type peptidyl-prolyl cis-trans isomerase SlpA
MTERVAEHSLITLNYRVTNQDGLELVSTFTTTPATLQLGATQAYGAHNPQLVQRVSRSDLPADAAPELDGVLQFASPGGTRFAGRVRQIEADSVLMDFNHPLAGQTIRFDAQIIGVM